MGIESLGGPEHPGNGDEPIEITEINDGPIRDPLTDRVWLPEPTSLQELGNNTRAKIVKAPLRDPPLHVDLRGVPYQDRMFMNGIPLLVPQETSWPDLEDHEGLFEPIRPSPYHERSFDLRMSTDADEHPFFTDEFGHWYSAISAKGITMEDPRLRYNPSTGFSVNGLLEASELPRTLAASKAFREAGIDTERILYAGVLRGYVTPDDLAGTDLEGLRAYTLSTYDALDYKPARRPNVVIPEGEYMVMVRATKINERIADLDPQFLEESEYVDALDRAIYLHNMDVALKEGKVSKDEELRTIDPENSNRYDDYLNYVLPTRMARNIAKMHDLGVSHDNLHCGNVTLLGEIVDIDTPSGPAIDPSDPPASLEAKMTDLDVLMRQSGIHTSFHMYGDLDKFKSTFYSEYMKQRDIDPKSIEASIVSLNCFADFQSYAIPRRVNRLVVRHRPRIEQKIQQTTSRLRTEHGRDPQFNPDEYWGFINLYNAGERMLWDYVPPFLEYRDRIMKYAKDEGYGNYDSEYYVDLIYTRLKEAMVQQAISDI